jgi:hypothetical protein
MRAIAIVVKVEEIYLLHLILTTTYWRSWVKSRPIVVALTHKASSMTYHFNLSDLLKIMKVRLYLAERREWSSR